MFDGVDIKKELIKVKSDINLLNSVNELLDNDIVKESVIEENITKSISKNYFRWRNWLTRPRY